MANSNLAIILLELVKLEEAETIIRKAIKLNSDSPNSNYILGLIFGALVLGIWSAETSVYKGLLGLGWTALALIALFFAEKNENN